MRKSAAAPGAKSFLRQLAHETDESATVALFVQLCRHSPALRHWLWEDFARDAATREQFASRLRRGAEPVARFAELTGEFDAWREERRQLQAKIPQAIYGGLTWQELEKLINHYRAGRTDLGLFILAQDWISGGASAVKSPRLMRRAAEYLDPILRAGKLNRLEQLAAAVRLVQDFQQPAKRRSAMGYTDWWKLQTLFFILRHPRPSYRTRDLRAHLARQGLRVGTKDIRRFCTRHGIRRDMRAGRPRLTPDPDGAPATRKEARPKRDAGRR